MKNNMNNATNILATCQGFDRQSLPNFDFHLHTSWTDGENTVAEMHQAATTIGLSKILFSEHVRRGSESWFVDFANEVRSCSKESCQALVGVETKILNFQGELDIAPTTIELSDLIMASVHRFPGEEGIIDKESSEFKKISHYDDPLEVEFRLANLILENPTVDILGHPFGMCYKRFKLIPPQHKIAQLIKKAAQTGVAFEVNSRYHPNLWELIDLCKKYGALVSLGSNAHSIGEVGKIINLLKHEVSCATN